LDVLPQLYVDKDPSPCMLEIARFVYDLLQGVHTHNQIWITHAVLRLFIFQLELLSVFWKV